mgnify:CR=1 FL=1
MSASRDSHRPVRVLLVEDSVINQQLVQGILEKEGHHVTVASNGQEAVDFDSREFDLVLMDVQMPDMDGYSLTKNIRGDQRLATAFQHRLFYPADAFI